MKNLNFNVTLFNLYKCFDAVQFEILILGITIKETERSLFAYFQDGYDKGLNILFFKIRWRSE